MLLQSAAFGWGSPSGSLAGERQDSQRPLQGAHDFESAVGCIGELPFMTGQVHYSLRFQSEIEFQEDYKLIEH